MLDLRSTLAKPKCCPFERNLVIMVMCLLRFMREVNGVTSNTLIPKCVTPLVFNPSHVSTECVESFLHLGELIDTTWDPWFAYRQVMMQFGREIDQ